jgi:PAS domain S-box-containing protein
MAKKPLDPGGAAALRRRAEMKAIAEEGKTRKTRYPEEGERALHELRVHQIELEMQNEELLRTQTDLEAARTRLSELYDQAPAGYLTVGEKGEIREANLTAVMMLGEEKASLVNKPITKFIFAEDQDIYYKHRKLLFESGVPQKCEFRMVRKNGTSFSARVDAAAVRTFDGQPVCRAVISDITERKAAEAALRESEKKYRALFDNAGEAIFVAQDGKLVFHNPMTSRMLDYPDEEIRNKPLVDFIHPDDRDMVVNRHMMRLKGEDLPDVYSFRILRRDETPLWVEIRAVLIAWEERPATLNFVSDVSERKRAEDSLTRSEKRFRELADLLPQIVFELDRKGDLIFANLPGLKSFGYSSEDLQAGINIVSLINPRDREKIQKRFLEVLGGAESGPREFQARRKDGKEFPILLHADAIFEEGSAIGARGIAIDITEQKRAEETIRASLREKEILLREVHHRVKNNMQVISSLFNLQASQIKDEGALRMLKEGQLRIRSMALVHEKLYRSGDLSKIDFAEYLQSLAAHLFHFYNISSDRVQLETALEGIRLDINSAVPCGLLASELITNALKHAFPNGRNGVLRIGLRRKKDGAVELKVADNGVGLPKNVDYRRAESFGLQIVALLAGQLEGILALDRKNGTAFTVVFREPEVKTGA